MGSRPSPFKEEIRVFLHQEVLLDLVVHSVGVSEYGHYTAQAEESVLNSGALNKAFFILVCCYGDIIITITMCSSCSTSIMQDFNPVNLVLAQIFHISLFYITLCPQNDVTRHLICINRNLE